MASPDRARPLLEIEPPAGTMLGVVFRLILGVLHSAQEVPDIGAEVVARDGLAAKPALTGLGDRAVATAPADAAHVYIKQLIRIFGGVLVDAATQHHAIHATVRDQGPNPIENDNCYSDEDCNAYCDRTPGIDDVHYPVLPVPRSATARTVWYKSLMVSQLRHLCP